MEGIWQRHPLSHSAPVDLTADGSSVSVTCSCPRRPSRRPGQAPVPLPPGGPGSLCALSLRFAWPPSIHEVDVALARPDISPFSPQPDPTAVSRHLTVHLTLPHLASPRNASPCPPRSRAVARASTCWCRPRLLSSSAASPSASRLSSPRSSPPARSKPRNRIPSATPATAKSFQGRTATQSALTSTRLASPRLLQQHRHPRGPCCCHRPPSPSVAGWRLSHTAPTMHRGPSPPPTRLF